MTWGLLQENVQRTVILNNDDSENISNKGIGVSHSLDTQSDGGCEHINGQTINFYVLTTD